MGSSFLCKPLRASKVTFFLVMAGGAPSGEWDECRFWLCDGEIATGRKAAALFPRNGLDRQNAVLWRLRGLMMRAAIASIWLTRDTMRFDERAQLRMKM